MSLENQAPLVNRIKEIQQELQRLDSRQRELTKKLETENELIKLGLQTCDDPNYLLERYDLSDPKFNAKCLDILKRI